jgi:cystathionine beta-lyase/cystathionine gamma-synthase
MSSILVPGDEVIAHPVVYGCTHSLFTNWYPKMGFEVKRVNMNNLDALAEAVNDKTRVLYLETPANPTLELIDLAALRAFADRINAERPEERELYIIVDNTFATPFCQRPLEHGAHLVVHSLTKNIGGFGTEIGGALIAPRKLLAGLLLYRKDFGAILNSKTAWTIMVYGLPTLPLRLKRQQYSAMKVATWLEGTAGVAKVNYPGLASFPQRALAQKQMRDFDGDFAPGNMIYFTVDDNLLDARVLLDHIATNAYSITLAVSLGHTKTLIESPSNMTHSSYSDEAAGSATGIRLSIGLESPGDILRDLETAIGAARRAPQPA